MATEADRHVRGREAGWLSVILRAASIDVTAIGCDRAVAPNANHAGPAIVAMLPVADALDVGRYVTDDWLASAPQAACARGPIFTGSGGPTRGNRVTMTMLPDSTLLRVHGYVGAVDVRGAYFEVVRDWPRGTGMRIGTYNTSSDTVWVLRYGPGKGGRTLDERAVIDPQAAVTLALLQRQFGALACPLTMNRPVELGDRVPHWESFKEAGWEWRNAWPPRPGRASGPGIEE